MRNKTNNANPLIEDLGNRGEKLLAEHIRDNEEALVKLKGTHGEAFVVTKSRVFVVKWGFVAGSTFGGRCTTYEFANITGIEYKKGLLIGSVEVQTPAVQNTQKSYWSTGKDGEIKSDNIVTFQKPKATAFLEGVKLARELINKWHNKDNTTNVDDALTQLEKLAKLKDKGIITEEEFQAKKMQLLGL